VSTIVTRAGKGSPLTNTEVDANFTNLNTDKAQLDTTVTFTSLTANDLKASSSLPFIYSVNTDVAASELRIGCSGSATAYRSRGGASSFGGHQFTRFDGTNTYSVLTTNADGDILFHDETGLTKARFDSATGNLRLGDNGTSNAQLKVDGECIVETLSSVGFARFGTITGAGSTGQTASAIEIRGTPAEVGSFTGTVSAGVLTVASGGSATLAVGQVLYDSPDIPANTFIESFGTGTGGAGTYNLSQSFDLSSQTLRVGDKSSTTLTITNIDGGVKAGQPIGAIDFNDSDGNNDGTKGFIVCGSEDVTPSTYLAFGTHLQGIGKHAREIARFDEEGNFLLNALAYNETLDHVELRQDGEIRSASLTTGTITATSSGSSPLTVNRNNANGTIIDLQANGVTKSVIGYNSNGEAFLRSDLGGFRFSQSGLRPTTDGFNGNDNAADLGTSSNRFKDLYLASGVYLGGTVAANKLDDYEEGEITGLELTDANGGNDGGNLATIETINAFYTKVGNTVHVIINLNNIDKGDPLNNGMTPTQQIWLRGLPFVISANSITITKPYTVQIDSGSGSTGVTALAASNSNKMQFRTNAENGSTAGLKVEKINNALADIQLNFCYKTTD